MLKLQVAINCRDRSSNSILGQYLESVDPEGIVYTVVASVVGSAQASIQIHAWTSSQPQMRHGGLECKLCTGAMVCHGVATAGFRGSTM